MHRRTARESVAAKQQMGDELRGRLQPSGERALLAQRLPRPTLPQGLEINKLAPTGSPPAKNTTVLHYLSASAAPFDLISLLRASPQEIKTWKSPLIVFLPGLILRAARSWSPPGRRVVAPAATSKSVRVLNYSPVKNIIWSVFYE